MKGKKILGIVLGLVALAVVAGVVAWRAIMAPYDGEPVRIRIPADASEASVRDSLVSALGGHFGNTVDRLWRFQKGTPATAHGSYLVEPGTSAINVARTIARGRQTPVRLTFNNLRTFGELAARVDAVLETDSASFEAAADSILGPEGFSRPQYAAAVLPDTYEFYWTASPQKVITTLLDYRNRFWTPERRNMASELGLTPEQAHTLASIVEEETNKNAERGAIARLYLNRIKKHIPLQADPTVKFALGDFGIRRVTSKHFNVESPYNTYKIQGLPVGPIRIAEQGTIDAVLNAPEHDYMYMCANSDFSGYHVFAETYDRHRINAAKYHRALNAKGIK